MLPTQAALFFGVVCLGGLVKQGVALLGLLCPFFLRHTGKIVFLHEQISIFLNFAMTTTKKVSLVKIVAPEILLQNHLSSILIFFLFSCKRSIYKTHFPAKLQKKYYCYCYYPNTSRDSSVSQIQNFQMLHSMSKVKSQKSKSNVKTKTLKVKRQRSKVKSQMQKSKVKSQKPQVQSQNSKVKRKSQKSTVNSQKQKFKS